VHSEIRGGGKCPEEEHTTCSGGPTINCHKRGLRGERIFMQKCINIYREYKNVNNNKMRKNGILPLKMELFTLEFRVFWLFF
jgi:hypothetical protein